MTNTEWTSPVVASSNPAQVLAFHLGVDKLSTASIFTVTTNKGTDGNAQPTRVIIQHTASLWL